MTKRPVSGKFGGVRELPSGRFQARYTAPNGQRIKAPTTFPSELAAWAWIAQEQRLIDLNAWTPPAVRAAKKKADSLTVGEWILKFHDSIRPHKAPGTMQNYDRRVRLRITKVDGTAAALRDIPLTELTKANLQAWWDAINTQFPDTATANYQAYQRLKAALAEAVYLDMIPSNPAVLRTAAKRPKPKKAKYLATRGELISVINAAPGRYRLVLALIFLCGLRAGEALGLEQKHLHLESEGDNVRGWVDIQQSANIIEPVGKPTYVELGPTKTEAGVRPVELPPTVIEYAQEHVKKHLPKKKVTMPATIGDTTNGKREILPLTATSEGNMPRRTSLDALLSGWIKKAGANPQLHFHAGRYYVNTTLAEQGFSPKAIGQYLGETDLSTITQVYMQVTENHRTQMAKALG
ncbi:tyrosine-type recombinase/integrase [Corynebacterium hindlerae]|uniref:tyrosine-type recombinase/integrase n=1 Tax=Corynebacterium hindlerae TaxID=699041 RepID=UPI003AAEB644